MSAAAATAAIEFKPGDLVRARGREWVVLPELRPDLLRLRPLGGAENDATLICVPLEQEPPGPATFDLPDPDKPGSQEAALLLRDALRLKLRAGAGPFRSFGALNFEPRAYQLVPLLMAMKLDTVRLLVADDVGIGKTIEAGLIVRELIDRGEVERFTVLCPPHLCEQWQQELAEKFSLEAEIVRTGTATRLERGLRPDESIFEAYPYTVVSLDYIKSDKRRHDFQRACPKFVIVDEAHTCVRSNTTTRHQRYQLLKGLAEGNPPRGIVLLTATPHSGNDTAFHNLLGLLAPKFRGLAELPAGDEHRTLRGQLTAHFVQRRRGDIAEWRDDGKFPVRESREATYQLHGDWGRLFEDVLAYARTMVERAEGGTDLQRRMSWWSALALLRCLSSSPAAATQSLRTRLEKAAGNTEAEQVANLDQAAIEVVMDEALDDLLTVDDSVPAGTVDSPDDAIELRRLIERATALRGPQQDPKLQVLIREVKKLLKNGFKPAVFCRFIATAHYVGEELRNALPKKKTHVEVVTGDLNPDQRRERVEDLGNLASGVAPVLVATDCLSEGVNLQDHFNAVVHYDLTWNPTRHEQREGRADRFGQPSPTVRALMLYGQDNPVDGAVLRVILRKADKIRKELGVAVPLPADNTKVVEAIMEAVLLTRTRGSRQMQLDLDLLEEAESQVDSAWRTATGKVSRTVFAQRRLRPHEVLPEWEKAVSVLGGQEDVRRFVCHASERLGTALEEKNGCFRIPVAYYPKPLQDRLEAAGFQPTSNGAKRAARISFSQPSPAGAAYIHRAHPLVSALADHIAETALETGRADLGARSSAIFTKKVETPTVLYLLRLRNQIEVKQRGPDGRFGHLRSLLAEECLAVAVEGDGEPELLSDERALPLFEAEPGRNMLDGQKSHLIRQALRAIPDREEGFNRIARRRADELLADHRRIREASNTKGLRYEVLPALPVDKIGVCVLLPMVEL